MHQLGRSLTGESGDRMRLRSHRSRDFSLAAGPGFFPTTLVGTLRMILSAPADKPKEETWRKTRDSRGAWRACSALA